MKDALGHGSDAHQNGVDQIGRSQTTPLARTGFDVTHSLGVNSEHVYTLTKDGNYAGEARLSHTGDYVVDLGVKPEFRGRGVASALYNHIEAHPEHQRRGIASQMMDRLKTEFTEPEGYPRIKWGMMTDEGAKFKRGYFTRKK